MMGSHWIMGSWDRNQNLINQEQERLHLGASFIISPVFISGFISLIGI
jgi:hypothetical protein